MLLTDLDPSSFALVRSCVNMAPGWRRKRCAPTSAPAPPPPATQLEDTQLPAPGLDAALAALGARSTTCVHRTRYNPVEVAARLKSMRRASAEETGLIRR